jgi:hypothetical protein
LGEASVAYLYYPSAAERISRLLPDAKLIVVLRCPADRAYANYLHALRLGREPLAASRTHWMQNPPASQPGGRTSIIMRRRAGITDS